MEKAEANKMPRCLLKLRDLWRTNPLFSTGMALVVMVIVQTAVLAMNSSFGTIGEWFQNWLQNWISLLRGNAGIGIIALGIWLVRGKRMPADQVEDYPRYGENHNGTEEKENDKRSA